MAATGEEAAKLKMVFPPTKTQHDTTLPEREAGTAQHICRVGGPTPSRNAVCVDL